ncbi:hypothetical protein LSTR_LSTR015049 [Laodelphax striatellus]|uniref:Uncharacterized protein n=1 Tax=Laodelphax striatellus TaxID=195883 RepID=A0A482WLQ1_LAOST|nr:hypothetical protein LSTR_LSTR015049 [Laodelphax striatellus]
MQILPGVLAFKLCCVLRESLQLKFRYRKMLRDQKSYHQQGSVKKWGSTLGFEYIPRDLAVFLVWFTQRYRAGYASKRAPTRTLSHRNGVETEDSDVWLTLYYCLFNVLAVTPTYAMMERIS